MIVETYVVRTIILSRANCCLGWRDCVFDLCRFADQTQHGALGTARGGTWWRSANRTRFVPGFLLDVDAVLAKNRGVSVVVNEATHDS
jgi:hypothetical protein